MFSALTLGLMPLLAQKGADDALVQYDVAFITAIVSIGVALISATVSIFTVILGRANQSALQREQAKLDQASQTEIERLKATLERDTQLVIERTKSDLSAKYEARLETLRADLSAAREQDLELLRVRLGEQGKERDARRDYEYEAHKRLYSECEPLLFQLAELSEHAYYRIYSLARSARLGHLPDWLEGDGYYLYSTVHKLLAPLVVFRLIQQRLTFIDLTLDRHIGNQYRLLKLLYLTFTDPFEFARLEPVLDYDPDVEDWAKKRDRNPQMYWRQGLYLGALDNSIDALATSEAPGRCKTYGEFESEMRDANSATRKNLHHAVDMLYGFHPSSRPVLWRMLWTQTLIYDKLLQSRTESAGPSSRLALSAVSPRLPAGSLDWRRNRNEAPDEAALVIPEQVAREYLRSRLSDAIVTSADEAND